jgi:hypothetical protein
MVASILDTVVSTVSAQPAIGMAIAAFVVGVVAGIIGALWAADSEMEEYADCPMPDDDGEWIGYVPVPDRVPCAFVADVATRIALDSFRSARILDALCRVDVRHAAVGRWALAAERARAEAYRNLAIVAVN